MTAESPCRRVVCANGRMSLVRLLFRCESRRTLGGSGPCRVGHLLGGPREHARAFRFLRALVVSHPVAMIVVGSVVAVAPRWVVALPPELVWSHGQAHLWTTGVVE